jgi:hypothetical protein
MLLTLILFGLSPVSHAASDFQGSIGSLLSCAYNATVNLDGNRFSYKWASPDPQSYFVASCSPMESDRNQIFIYSKNSVSGFSFAEPKAYKGGMEQPLYRLLLDNQTFYFKEDITGGMAGLYDRDGIALYPEADSTREHIDTSSKNLALTYYMQQVAGKANASGSLAVRPITADQQNFALSCMVKNTQWLAKSLLGQFTGKAGKGASPAELARFQTQILTILKSENCSVDAGLKSYIDKVVRVIDLIASGRITIVNRSSGLSFSTQYSGTQEDIDAYRDLTKALE